MQHHPHPTAHIIKRVTLPSGKSVELVSFVERRREPRVARTLPVSICPSCGHDRVQPVAWEEAGPEHWMVTLRCPDCEERREARCGQDQLDDFDIALDAGTRSVAADLDLLARANMADDIDRFIKALNGDHVVPEDF